MKHVIILLSAMLSVTVSMASSFDILWDEANTAYINADYKQAIERYDSILASGHESYKLYYNLGNAYFKEGKIGPSILNYNRALKLAPSDQDIKYNLRIANSHVKDKIDTVPEFFVKTWIRSLRHTLSSNSWAIVSMVMFALALAAALLYLLSEKLPLRKTGFYTAIILFCFFIIAVIFSSIERKSILYPSEAIIMRSSASVKSSPDKASKDIFLLHEGTKVKIVGTLNEWREIMVSDGNKGWILSSSIEPI